jgi:hypothetical protein
MKLKAHRISNKRLDRLLVWSRLWLLRLAAWIVQAAGIYAPLDHALRALIAPPLKKVEKLICLSIAAKAVKRLHFSTPRKGQGRATRPAHFMRSLIGARLRKLCRAKDLRAKISALLALIEHAEAEIARFTRHIKSGLSRRRGGVPRSAFKTTILAAAPAMLLCGADTS